MEAVIATLLQSIDALVESLAADVDGGYMYRFIAASQTDAPLESVLGAIGDRLEHIIVIPTNATPGTVLVQDGAGTAMTVYAGTGVQPLVIPIHAKSVNGVWSITTGTNVTVWAVGEFS